MAAKTTKKSTSKAAASKTSTVTSMSGLRRASPVDALAEEIAKGEALSAEYATRYPDQPVAVTVAEGTRIAELVRGKAAALAKVGVDKALVTGLEARVALLVRREAEWNKARAKNRAGISPARIKAAEELKSQVYDGARFLLRRDAVVQQQLDQIAQGTGVADLVEDLTELGLIVKDHPSVFLDDPTFPKDAAEQCAKFATELSVGLDPQEAAEALEARNRAFWLLVEAISEVRAALRYLWRKKPAMLATLGISYVAATSKRIRRRRSAAKAAASEPAPKAE